jgi:hypothetical protein
LNIVVAARDVVLIGEQLHASATAAITAEAERTVLIADTRLDPSRRG